MDLKQFMEGQGKELKETAKAKPDKEFQNMTATEKWSLVEMLLRDLGYIK